MLNMAMFDTVGKVTSLKSTGNLQLSKWKPYNKLYHIHLIAGKIIWLFCLVVST